MRPDEGPEAEPLGLAPGVRKVLITGATGFLGRHLGTALAAAGIEVVGIARATGHDILRDALPLDGVDHVFHLAAATGVVAAWADPQAVLLTNSHGTIRVLDQCRQRSCPVTFASSYVYGTPERLPVAEHHPVRPSNPYALSKLLAEQSCHAFAVMFGLPVSVLRVFNIYGPGQDERFLVPLILRQVLDRTLPEVVVQDLAPRRDYVHVGDVVRAFTATTRLREFALFNVGSGVSHSVADVIQLACAAAGRTKPGRQTGPVRPADVPDTVADISAIGAALGWAPRISLADGLRGMVAA
jgi:nucleoside-diphosphate-sugar epimerase